MKWAEGRYIVYAGVQFGKRRMRGAIIEHVEFAKFCTDADLDETISEALNLGYGATISIRLDGDPVKLAKFCHGGWMNQVGEPKPKERSSLPVLNPAPALPSRSP